MFVSLLQLVKGSILNFVHFVVTKVRSAKASAFRQRKRQDIFQSHKTMLKSFPPLMG